MTTSRNDGKTARPGWELVWAEEFAGSGAIDPAVWRFERGMVRNQEEQWYRDSQANCRRENGQLLITAVRNLGQRTVGGKAAAPDLATCTSASVRTHRSFLFGRLEVRARVPRGRGVWPAAWLLGTNISGDGAVGWPRCGEIDIMEYVGKLPDSVHATVHWYQPAIPEGAGPAPEGFPKEAREFGGAVYFPGGHVQCGREHPAPEPWRDFHVYAVEWDENKMVFFYDDAVALTFEYAAHGLTPDTNPFLKPHFLLLNLAMGGHWGGEIDDAVFPAVYAIDCVRYYRRKA